MKKIIFLANLLFLCLYSHTYSQDYSWKLVDSINDDNIYYYRSIAFSDSVFILGGSRGENCPMTRISFDNCKTWEFGFIDSSSNDENYIHKVFIDKNNRGLALTDYSGYYYYTDNLKDWTKKQFTGSTYLWHFCSDNYGDKILYSMGDVVYQTTDYGETWTEIFSPHQDADNPKIVTQIEMLSEDEIYIIYYYRKDYPKEVYQLARSFDGGQTWEDLYTSPYRMYRLKFTSKNIAYAFGEDYRNGDDGNKILKTIDGGNTWEQIYVYYDFNRPVWSVDFANDSVGIFADINPKYYRTDDGGATWYKETSMHDLCNSIGIQVGCFKFLDDKTILMGSLYGGRQSRYIYMFTDRDDFPLGTSIEDFPALLHNAGNSLVFPNPSSEVISLDLGGLDFADLVIYDVLGYNIMSIPNYINKSEIEISNLPTGTYTIHIQTGTGIYSQKLMVRR